MLIFNGNNTYLSNIAIQWDMAEEPLSADAIDAVEQLLTMDPSKRPTSKEVQTMKFFSTIDWNGLQGTEPPFVPQPQDQYDTGYFEPRNIMQHLKLSNIDISELIKEAWFSANRLESLSFVSEVVEYSSYIHSNYIIYLHYDWWRNPKTTRRFQ